MSSTPAVSVHFLPALIAPEALSGGVAVVVDVLRATTVMVHALASGCRAIVPCLEIDEARRVAAGLPPGSAVLAGERQGVPIAGFDLGNSPEDFSPGACAGKTLVMTTTNGTRAILASTSADRVLIGAFVNRRAVLRRIEAEEGVDVHIVCSGTDGRVSLEDSLLAGALAYALGSSGGRTFGNDSALIASRCWEATGPASGSPAGLESLLVQGRGGRRVTELGLRADLDAASRLDRFDLVPEFDRDRGRIVAPGAPETPRIG